MRFDDDSSTTAVDAEPTLDTQELECITIARELLDEVTLQLGFTETSFSCPIGNSSHGATQEIGGFFDLHKRFTFVFGILLGRTYMEFSWIFLREAASWYIVHEEGSAALALDRQDKTIAGKLAKSLETDLLTALADRHFPKFSA